MIVEHILNKKKLKEIITVSKSDTILTAIKLLSKNNIGAIPVTTNGLSVDGILSERDIVKNIALKGDNVFILKVQEIMTRVVSSCSKEDSLKEVIARMNKGRFRHMPVLEDNKMIGFISISDLVLSHLNEIEFENNAMRGSVSGTL